MSGTLQILLTGGTGSFGQAFVRRLLASRDDVMIRIYSRDELKQFEMARRFDNDERLRFLIGDIRDLERLRRAMTDVDLAIHAAAMKQVPICEYNPAEAVKTNVIGAMNVLESCLDVGVPRAIALSTDKAVNPANLYGATKLCMEKLFIHGNAYAGKRGTRFAVVRYGNVVGSRGSVIPLFLKQAPSGVMTVTDERMTRFWISLEQAVELVVDAMDRMQGKEIFVPKIPSMRIVDLARAIRQDAMIKEIGIRPGEKMHEVLLTADEARDARDFDTYYVIGGDPKGGRQVPEGFVYSSDSNTQWMSVDHLAEVIETWKAERG